MRGQIVGDQAGAGAARRFAVQPQRRLCRLKRIEAACPRRTDQARQHVAGASACQPGRRGRRYRDTVRELQGLSTRELNDLGINRSEIGRLAREASRL